MGDKAKRAAQSTAAAAPARGQHLQQMGEPATLLARIARGEQGINAYFLQWMPLGDRNRRGPAARGGSSNCNRLVKRHRLWRILFKTTIEFAGQWAVRRATYCGRPWKYRVPLKPLRGIGSMNAKLHTREATPLYTWVNQLCSTSSSNLDSKTTHLRFPLPPSSFQMTWHMLAETQQC